MDESLNILVVSDLHYSGAPGDLLDEERWRESLGPLLLRKAWDRLAHLGVEVGLVVILGDVVPDGLAPGAQAALEEVADMAHACGVPVLAVAGNHDVDNRRFVRIFRSKPGLHEVGGYGFFLFYDCETVDEAVTRRQDELDELLRLAADRPELPLVTLQHNPIDPHIESDYAYMPTNAVQIAAAYAKAGVLLSLSGHYHAGQAAHQVGDATYHTVAALHQEPFRFTHVELRGREVRVHEHSLKMDRPGLIDTHCHTEFAYCGTSIVAERNAALSRRLGIERVYLTEHSFQLYFDSNDAWSTQWQTDDAMVDHCWRSGRGRMPRFREFAAGMRSASVGIGLELDLRADGSLLLAEEDRTGWDILLCSVHWIHDFVDGVTDQARAEELFLRNVRQLLSHPIDILTHPFRFFRRAGLKMPTHLYEPVADLLAQHGVAAEINFHINRPDPRFVRACVERGVHLALASDAHHEREVGELLPHLNVLRAAGVRDEDFARVLFRP